MSDKPDLKVVPLPPPTKESRVVIEALRCLITEFERGDVESFMLVAVRSDGTITRARGLPDHANRFTLIGAAEHDIRSVHKLLELEANPTLIYTPDDEPA